MHNGYCRPADLFIVSRILNWLLEWCSQLANALASDLFATKYFNFTLSDMGCCTVNERFGTADWWQTNMTSIHCISRTQHTHALNRVRLENHMSADWWTRWVTVMGACNWRQWAQVIPISCDAVIKLRNNFPIIGRNRSDRNARFVRTGECTTMERIMFRSSFLIFQCFAVVCTTDLKASVGISLMLMSSNRWILHIAS